MLDQIAESSQWQSEIDSALTAWLQPLGVVAHEAADSGVRFGIAGRAQGDARFGDIRIAAIPLSEDVIATSVPHSSIVQGSWAGDVLLNSNASWNSLQEVFAVAFHEFGHVLGLEHSLDPASPMFVHGVHDVTSPTEADLAKLLELYNGIEFEEQRESSGRGSGDQSDSAGGDFASAVPLTPIVGTTLRYTAVGAINDPSIPTIYRLEPSLGEAEDLEHLNIALHATGPGRLIAEVQIFDEDGDKVESQVIHHGEGAIVVQARNVENGETYFVQVRSANTSPDYQVGGFEIVMDYGPEVRESREIADLRISDFTPIIQQSFSVASSRFVHLHFDSDLRDGPGSRVWATLSNSLGQQVAQTTLQAGESRSMPVVFLPSGEYSIQVTTGAPGETIVGETRVNVFVDEISIDVGPGVSNPTGEPYLWCEDPNANPDYCYEYTPIDVPEPTAPDPDTEPDLSDPEWWVYYGFSCDDYTGTDLQTVQEEDPLWWDFYVEVCQATAPPTTPTNPPTTPTDPPTTPTDPPTTPTDPPTTPTDPPTTPTDPPTTPTDPPTTPTDPPTTPTDPPTTPTDPQNGTHLSPWQNRLDQYDVSGNQQVTAMDALMVINFLGRHVGETINVTNALSDVYMDVNGDFFVSAVDALMVINALARQRIEAEAEVVSMFLTELDLVHEKTDWTLVDPEEIPSLF